MKERKSKASNLEEKLKDKDIRQKLGMNEDLYEERKQQKYLYSINYNETRSPEDSIATEQNRKRSSLNRIEFEKNDLEDEKEGDESDDEEDDEDDKESVLSDISNESTYFQKKVNYQRRALFRKNVSLQWRQRATNCIQFMSPVIGLSIIVIFKALGLQSIIDLADQPIFVPFPQLFGINMRALAQLTGYLNVTTCKQWYMYEFENDVSAEDKAFFGYNEGYPAVAPNSSGILDGKYNVFQYPCNENNRSSPFFMEFDSKKFNDTTSTNDYLRTIEEKFSEIDMELTDRNFDFPEIDELPDGAYKIKQSNQQKLKYNLQINNQKYWQYHKNNGITKISYNVGDENEVAIRTIEGALAVTDLLNQAYMRKLFNDTTVISGVNFFPFNYNVDGEINKVISLMCIVVLPVCMSMGLPVFLYQIVLEKETRLVETMKINGMKMANYWYINFIFNFAFYCIQAFLFLFFGIQVFKIEVFVLTNLPLMIFTMVGWGLAQISMAFFVSVFINKSQTASIVGYTMAIWFTTVACTFNVTIFQPPNHMDWFLYLIPSFTFARLFGILSYKCGYEDCIYNISDIDNEGACCLVFLYLMAVAYIIFGLYLYQVVPQTYGVSKKWNYLCVRSKNKAANRRDTDEIGDLENEREQRERPVFDFDLSLEDNDSKAERNMVYNLDKADYYKYPLIIKDLRKVYPGFGGRPPKAATRSFCLRIKKGEMFGLLGPNGAGKTTLISILTGLYPPTQGNAWVAGYDIRDQLEIVQLQIGVCPQFDVLWNDLTIEEHLLFYARLKGIPPEEEKEKVETAIQEVLLHPYRKFLVKQLSGGMKRRLSVAISLVSEPKIIFLDEPTTGLDPENRRQLWDILSRQKGKRAIILTTHSMEEADVLCNRIGIVSDGILRCVGPQVRLKSIYGGGYHLFINCQRGKIISLLKRLKRQQKRQKQQEEKKKLLQAQSLLRSNQEELKGGDEEPEEDQEEVLNDEQIIKRVSDFIKQLLPTSILIREFNGSFVYQIPIDGFEAEDLFLSMEKNKERLRITDWGFSQCSLEDVFSRIVEPK